MGKYTIILIIVAAVVLEVIGAAQYFMARQGVKRELLAKAERDMAESQRVAVVKAQVENAVNGQLPAIENALHLTETSRILISRLVSSTPSIVGAGIAFRKGFFANKGVSGLYAPYAYDDRPEEQLNSTNKGRPNIKSSVLGFDYTDREWFKKPISGSGSLWTQPYMDKGGTHILLCTYVVPIKQKGVTVGVFFADVPLQEVSILSQNLNSGIAYSGVITLLLQILSLAVLCFIIWKTVKAVRQNNEQKTDPEKVHMAEQLTKLKEVNTRLTKRNQELAEKVALLQRRIQSSPQMTDTHWFG